MTTPQQVLLTPEDVHAAFSKHFPKTRISQAWISFAADLHAAILAKLQASPQAQAEGAQPPGKWEGAEEWMPLAWELCADECGEDACTELVWEGGPIPEPWGDRWLKYEDEAKRLIALVRKHVPSVQAQAGQAAQGAGKWVDPAQRLPDAGRHVPVMQPSKVLSTNYVHSDGDWFFTDTKVQAWFDLPPVSDAATHAPAPVVAGPDEHAAAVLSALAKRCYAMSESHLSGARLIVGFERLDDASDAHMAIAGSPRTAPVALPMTEEHAVLCLVKAGCIGTVKMSYDTGPYGITRTSINADKLIRAVEAHHGITTQAGEKGAV